MVWRAFGQGRYAALAAKDVVAAIGHSTLFQRCSPPSLPTLRRRAAAEIVCAATAGGETSRSRNKPAVAHDKPKVALLHDGSEDRKYAAQRVEDRPSAVAAMHSLQARGVNLLLRPKRGAAAAVDRCSIDGLAGVPKRVRRLRLAARRRAT